MKIFTIKKFGLPLLIAGAFAAALCCSCASGAAARGGNQGGYQNVGADAPTAPVAQAAPPAQEVEQRRAPAPEPEPQGPPRKVAVFMKGTEPRELRGSYSVLSSRLIAALADSKAYTAVDRTEDVKQILAGELEYQMSGAVADDDVRKAGMQLGVQYVCIAMISEVMGSYLIEARLVNVESAEVAKLASKQNPIRTADQLMEAVENTVREFINSRK